MYVKIAVPIRSAFWSSHLCTQLGNCVKSCGKIVCQCVAVVIQFC